MVEVVLFPEKSRQRGARSAFRLSPAFLCRCGSHRIERQWRAESQRRDSQPPEWLLLLGPTAWLLDAFHRVEPDATLVLADPWRPDPPCSPWRSRGIGEPAGHSRAHRSDGIPGVRRGSARYATPTRFGGRSVFGQLPSARHIPRRCDHPASANNQDHALPEPRTSVRAFQTEPAGWHTSVESTALSISWQPSWQV